MFHKYHTMYNVAKIILSVIKIIAITNKDYHLARPIGIELYNQYKSLILQKILFIRGKKNQIENF